MPDYREGRDAEARRRALARMGGARVQHRGTSTDHRGAWGGHPHMGDGRGAGYHEREQLARQQAMQRLLDAGRSDSDRLLMPTAAPNRGAPVAMQQRYRERQARRNNPEWGGDPDSFGRGWRRRPQRVNPIDPRDTAPSNQRTTHRWADQRQQNVDPRRNPQFDAEERGGTGYYRGGRR